METDLKWKLSADQNTWLVFDGERLVNTVHWDKERGGFGAYVDSSGRDLGREFNNAKAAVDSAARGKRG